MSTAQLEQKDAPECRLFEAPACQRIHPASTDAIFVGSVLKITESDGHMMLDGHCSKTLLQTVAVQVKEAFVGGENGVVPIHAGDINGFYFLTGETFLIYARLLGDGSLAVTGCGGTKKLIEAQEDLAYLRAWQKLPRTSRIFGGVWGTVDTHGPDKPEPMVLKMKPLAGVKVSVAGTAALTLTTDPSGHFEVNALPAGRYTVGIESPLNVWPEKRQNVDVVERGCALVNFRVDKPYAQKH